MPSAPRIITIANSPAPRFMTVTSVVGGGLSNARAALDFAAKASRRDTKRIAA
jgi:hypothetical protein